MKIMKKEWNKWPKTKIIIQTLSNTQTDRQTHASNMMMAAMAGEDEGEDFFSALVSIEEKSLIPESLARKLQDAWTTKVKEVKGLKVEREKQKLGSGKRVWEWEWERLAFFLPGLNGGKLFLNFYLIYFYWLL